MKRLLIGGVAGSCLGVGLYLAFTTNDAPAPAEPPQPPVVMAPQTPPTPVVLAQVIEVTDLEPLLDPPARPVVGVPFEGDSPTVRIAAPVAAPDRIPPAVD